MKKAIHKLELNIFLADKILEVLNIHSKEAKNTTNLTGRITFYDIFPMRLVSKFAPQIGFIMIVSALQVYRKWSAVRFPLANPGFPKFRKKPNRLTLFFSLNPRLRRRLNNTYLNALWLEQKNIHYLMEF